MTLSAILLAGGRSRRMGVDKATVLIAGKPLWERQLRILSELWPEALWVSARAVPPWCPPEIEAVFDRPPSRGPLSGLAAGLRRLKTSHLAVLAIDLPQMTSEHLNKLWGLVRPGVGVVPLHGDYFEPLCAVYPAEALAAAEAALKGSDASLQHFAQTLLRQSRIRVYDLTPEEWPLYLNVNTPADLPAKVGASNPVKVGVADSQKTGAYPIPPSWFSGSVNGRL
ncbi:MAG: Molybdopterin-guanine dinucleotide biosynthesis protein A-like protein [Pedosphaera sp.]|nr:Molybdopterin-guanine dinucleotide biosynthesis protein A-like protein [Pedosphaera sp.]